MGHSFGARLVSYALAGLPAGLTGAASPVKSLTLIQGAFSHFTFASTLPFDGSRGGELAGRGARVDGPLLATFTAADRAVGWWYPAASMLARQDNQAADDVTYQWGAMGHDGYQQTARPDRHARSRQRESRTISRRASSTSWTPTPSSTPINPRSAAPTATSATPRCCGP